MNEEITNPKELLCPKAGTATSSPFLTTTNLVFQCCQTDFDFAGMAV